MGYDREVYWSEVAGRMAQRTSRRDVAGDADAYYAYKRRKMLRRFLATLPVDDREVLELGCGPGGNLEWLLNHRRPRRVIGVDIASTMLNLAAERLSDRARLHKADGRTIPMPDRSVDLAFTVTVLQHNVEDGHMQAMVCELARVSRHTVVLIEDVVPVGRPALRGESWIGRPTAEYEVAGRSAGLRLVGSEALRTRLTRAGLNVLSRVFAGRAEGTTRPALFSALLAAWVTVAKHCDDWVADGNLTKLTFVRD